MTFKNANKYNYSLLGSFPSLSSIEHFDGFQVKRRIKGSLTETTQMWLSIERNKSTFLDIQATIKRKEQ